MLDTRYLVSRFTTHQRDRRKVSLILASVVERSTPLSPIRECLEARRPVTLTFSRLASDSPGASRQDITEDARFSNISRVHIPRTSASILLFLFFFSTGQRSITEFLASSSEPFETRSTSQPRHIVVACFIAPNF